MKKVIISTGLLSVMLLLLYCNNGNDKTASGPRSKEESIKHGGYLVATMGCNDCHTPKKFGPMGPELDTTKLLSGHPSDLPLAKIDTTVLKDWMLMGPMISSFVGPWGISYAANLTSDSATGIGMWTFDQFKTCLTKGKFNGDEKGRPLLPPMPWQGIANMKEDDMKDMFEFLKSTRPIKNLVPAAVFGKLP